MAGIVQPTVGTHGTHPHGPPPSRRWAIDPASRTVKLVDARGEAPTRGRGWPGLTASVVKREPRPMPRTAKRLKDDQGRPDDCLPGRLLPAVRFLRKMKPERYLAMEVNGHTNFYVHSPAFIESAASNDGHRSVVAVESRISDRRLALAGHATA
ncbi:hypothetical protein GCM10012280_09240 [Wenjunlia tyrosinilytica]|uniref:Uncharacterized protein n=1 Tax=Wenjunlia tyrosinilytica TaxID=1544741 RepID=A0A918DUG7_9ACTN|nr:hypothetical protein GCM10012280_09240 [Wenjunlia tyrosinilytica]